MFSERMVLGDDAMLDLEFRSPRDYRLAYLRAGRVLVEFGSARSYEFKSVEKLRYDFERAIEDALRQG
jgi:hypothetical protein